MAVKILLWLSLVRLTISDHRSEYESNFFKVGRAYEVMENNEVNFMGDVCWKYFINYEHRDEPLR